MKKMSMICMAALLVMAASCKKEKKVEMGEDKGFHVTAEAQVGDSKTHLEGLSVKWDDEDEILVCSSSKTDGWKFIATAVSEDGKTAIFNGDGGSPAQFYQSPFKAFYPFGMMVSGSANTLSLPAIQTYAEGSFAADAYPMVAVSSSTDLYFRNICGILELRLQSAAPCMVKNITITTNGENEKLWGTGTVDLTDPTKPILGELTDGGNSVMLDCGDGVDISSEKIFRIVVPAGTLGSSFEVRLTDSNNKIWYRTAYGAQNTIGRSKITWLGVSGISTHTSVTPSAVTVIGPCVSCAYNVGGTVKVPTGSHACEFGLVYAKTADNATPTITEGATKIVVHAMGEDAISGTVSFKADLSCLEEGVEYSVRAYALCDEVAYSSEATVMNIIGGNMPKPLPSNWVNGKNPHPFTVAKNKVVYFSQGNLQYLAKGGSAGDASATAASGESVGGTWRFAEHQFDAIGAANDNASSTYSDWIDLFGWATSGYNHNNGRYQPWSKGNGNYYAYGTTASNHLFSQTPAIADWGYNAISNGGGFGWRTPTGDSNGEWNYILTKRDDASQLYGYGKIGNCTKGLIILPDDWICPAGLSFTSGLSDWLNVYSYSDWSKMEAAGAVFLPVFGYRLNSGFGDEGRSGYWASTYGDGNCACCIFIGNSEFVPNSVHGHGYSQGLYVRLVSDSPN